LRIQKECEVRGEDFRLGATELEGCASLQLLQVSRAIQNALERSS